jgi:ATP-dependent DNA helicase RecG
MKSLLDLEALAQQEEGQFFDRKSLWEGAPGVKRVRDRRTVRDEIAAHVAAFANADGGVLILGVEDDGTVTGHGYPDEAIQGFLDVPTKRLQPPQACGATATVAGKPVIVFQVEPAPSAVMVTGDGFPYRSHDQVVQLAETAINAIKQRGFIESAEARMSQGRALSDLDQGLLGRAIKGAGLEGTSVEDYLVETRRLADRRGDSLILREAALLLFARDTSKIDHPNASVRVFRVQGTTRRTGRNHNVQELPRCEGNLVQVLEGARKLLSTVIQKSAKLHDLFFREMPEYPTLAWQEALVNAVAHRDYGIQGRSVEVWLFDDRMEVVSPGGLLPEIRLEDLQARRAVHASRNPRLARVLVELDIMREQGEGIPRMFEEMEESWLPMPELVADASSFRVILRNEPIFASSDPDWVRTAQALSLDPRQKRTLIRFAEGDFANGDYQEMNGVDRDQSYRELQQLVELGLLAATGQSKGMRYHVVRTGAIRGTTDAAIAPIVASGTGVAQHGGAHAMVQSQLDALKLRMSEAGFITNSDYRETFGATRRQAKRGLAAWLVDGTLKVEGRGRSARYLPGPKWPPEAPESEASEIGPENGPKNGPNGPENGPNGPGRKNG